MTAACAAVAGLVVGLGPGSSRGASKPAKSSGSATVQRRDLVATDTESGTLSYADPATVFNRMSGTVTWLPSVGQVIKPGQALYSVNGQPVVLFNGRFPAYRALSSGVSDGPDVLELNQNLVARGFDPSHEITVNDTWQTGTTDAVDRWQASLGETQTGSVALGQVVFLAGPRRITAVNASLGGTGASGSGAGSGSSTAASFSPGAAQAEFVSLTTTTTTTTTTAASAPRPPKSKQKGGGSNGGAGSASTIAALLALLKAETLELQRSRASSSASGGAGAARSSSGSSRSGASSGSSGAASGAASSSSSASGGGSGASAILQTSSTHVVVTVDLDATKQSEAVVGEHVSVELPDGSTVGGRISYVSPVAQSSSSSSSSGASGGGGSSGSASATIPVTITLAGRGAAVALDQAAVSVNFEQQKALGVLSVPVTALLATAGGGYAVQEAAAPHTMIPVTPGLFAAGYVQISGPGLYEGLQVTDSQG